MTINYGHSAELLPKIDSVNATKLKASNVTTVGDLMDKTDKGMLRLDGIVVKCYL